ncbi:MAG: hypothetical protein JNJ50_27370 [Acidobacteria bacterium]|nr:hypothetical protein [Acidobacteriota bacterium]
MKFPFVVIPELTDRQLWRYHNHINSDASGWHRRWTESIWRRHQHPSNARLSGWLSPADQKRRILHFYDEYGVADRAFVLRNAYLWMHVSLPEEHIDEYEAVIRTGLSEGNWQADGTETARGLRQERFRLGDLTLRLARCQHHPEDEKRGRRQPPGYHNLELWLMTNDYHLPDGWDERPWKVFFEVGLRKALTRGTPTIITPEQIADHLPAQLELGCGPSIAAGIPHLSSLHRIYGVSLLDYGFIFRAAQDGLLSVVRSPETKYAEMTGIYRACALAEGTPFYEVIDDLMKRELLVGKIITNNFDCLCADRGLPEISLRRYDWGPYYPHVQYDPRARSLLVVGVHADRRLIQMRARQQNLRVVFVDPERYVAPDGRVISYPVEAPQTEDFFVRATAEEALPRLHRALEKYTQPQ